MNLNDIRELVGVRNNNFFRQCEWLSSISLLKCPRSTREEERWRLGGKWVEEEGNGEGED